MIILVCSWLRRVGNASQGVSIYLYLYQLLKPSRICYHGRLRPPVPLLNSLDTRGVHQEGVVQHMELVPETDIIDDISYITSEALF